MFSIDKSFSMEDQDSYSQGCKKAAAKKIIYFLCPLYVTKEYDEKRSISKKIQFKYWKKLYSKRGEVLEEAA